MRIMGEFGWLRTDNATVDALIRANWQTPSTLDVGSAYYRCASQSTKLDSIHLLLAVGSVASIDCAIKTLRTLDALQPPPRDLLIQTRNTDDVLSSFSEVLVDTLGMRLANAKPGWMRYLRP
ncbi:hypothetical protein BDZ89DRAFT_1146255 [Hymenopellis radicata]|nr:hypothetical protein BDZ89DRAFT_1146255 [Hymenopellis radicata]